MIKPIKMNEICGKNDMEYGNSVWKIIEAINVQISSTTLIKLKIRPCSSVAAIFESIDLIAVGENLDNESRIITIKKIFIFNSNVQKNSQK